MQLVYLGIGTNLGDRKKNIISALSVINERIGTIVKKSSVYITEPWGFKSEKYFLNLVVIVKTPLNPDELLFECQQAEIRLLRKKRHKNKYESRVIDIDIIFYLKSASGLRNEELKSMPDAGSTEMSTVNVAISYGEERNIEHFRRWHAIQLCSRKLLADLRFYNLIINKKDLIIPHPLLHKRIFVLMPLLELSPDMEHPLIKSSIRELYEKCDDTGKIRKLKLKLYEQ